MYEIDLHGQAFDHSEHDVDYPRLPVAASSLDRLETSGLHYGNLSQTFRHSGWARQRKKVAYALDDAACSDSRQVAFAGCGATCYLFRSRADPTEVKCAASCCHDRFCLPCGASRSRVIAANVAEYLGRGACRFVTFTLRHDGLGLASNVDRLYESFKKIRKSVLWRSTQRGGVAFLEVKRSRDRLSWHPHFHVLTQGKFVDGVKLAKLWHEITGDSFIVDIRGVKDSGEVIKYITKYASKPFDPTLFEDEAVLVEAIKALQGRRMALTFGNWNGLQVTTAPSEEAWECVGSLEEVLQKAVRGDREACAMIRVACGEKAEMMLRLAVKMLPEPPRPYAIPPPPDQLCLIDVRDSLAYARA